MATGTRQDEDPGVRYSRPIHNWVTGGMLGQETTKLAGAYTLWIQQTSAQAVTYEFQAQFSPVPAPLPALGASAGWDLSRLRQQIQGAMAA